ncbi:MAG TPA: EamA family transporter [Candidatus Udaeobacter sp.]|jgi:drug/metabolite transporter (DMT)-like permease|nr:EamA family transporter [Candidatus Udaeobacter sp.]
MADRHSFMAAPTKIRIIIAFAALYLIWGSTYLGIRFAIETIPPFLMAGSRFLLAGIIMYAIAWSQGITKSSWANWRTSLIIGACLILGGNGGVTVSEKYIDSGLAALIVAIVPIYIVVLGWAAGIAPRPTPIVWLGLIGGFVGVGVLLGPALGLSSNGGRHPAIGMSILLVSSFIWSAGSLYSRTSRHAASPFLTAAQQMLCGGLLLLLASFAIGETRLFHPNSMSILSLASFAYLVIIGAVVGYTAYIWLLRHCDPAKVATYAYVNPIVAVLLGAAFAGEILTMRTLVAASLIIGSVALVITAQQLKLRAEPQISAAVTPAD